MDYKLALALKNAGFPLKETASINGGVFLPYEIIDGKQYKVPTLEELIEGCGDRFGKLSRNGSFDSYTPLNNKWVAWATNKDINSGGETPKEAVVKLYLELHKK